MQDLPLRLHRRQEPPDRPCRILLLRGPSHLSTGLGLTSALLKRGLPRRFYLDNGPAFRSHHLEEITASLGNALVRSPSYVPQGRGKIEKFFRTVRFQFFPGFKDDTLRDIN
ncbi:transposase [Desulfarculales bacterium]